MRNARIAQRFVTGGRVLAALPVRVLAAGAALTGEAALTVEGATTFFARVALTGSATLATFGDLPRLFDGALLVGAMTLAAGAGAEGDEAARGRAATFLAGAFTEGDEFVAFVEGAFAEGSFVEGAFAPAGLVAEAFVAEALTDEALVGAALATVAVAVAEGAVAEGAFAERDLVALAFVAAAFADAPFETTCVPWLIASETDRTLPALRAGFLRGADVAGDVGAAGGGVAATAFRPPDRRTARSGEATAISAVGTASAAAAAAMTAAAAAFFDTRPLAGAFTGAASTTSIAAADGEATSASSMPRLLESNDFTIHRAVSPLRITSFALRGIGSAKPESGT